MPAEDVLRSATLVAARSAGAADRMGTLEAGKLANFIVLDENPVADLRNLASIWCTVKRGVPHARVDFVQEAP
jgi:imidazolonepropionase-like amidohydrolase